MCMLLAQMLLSPCVGYTPGSKQLQWLAEDFGCGQAQHQPVGYHGYAQPLVSCPFDAPHPSCFHAHCIRLKQTRIC